MDKAITGTCRCGAIAYAFDALPTLRHICCCRDCQYFTGTDKVFVIGGPRSTFRLLRGEPKAYAVTADSGATIMRAFCPVCGTSLFIYPHIDGVHYSKDEDVIEACAATLDNPDAFAPDFAVFVSRARKWTAFPKGLSLYD